DETKRAGGAVRRGTAGADGDRRACLCQRRATRGRRRRGGRRSTQARGAGLRRRGRVDQHRQADQDRRPQGPRRPARLLDVLLHQLHPRVPGPEVPRAEVQGRAVRGRRRALRQVRPGEGPREHPQRRAPPQHRPPGGGRLGVQGVEGVRRQRVADAGADRPGGQRARRPVGRGPPRDARRGDRQGAEGAQGQGHAGRQAADVQEGPRDVRVGHARVPRQGAGRRRGQAAVRRGHEPPPRARHGPRRPGDGGDRRGRDRAEGRQVRRRAAPPAAGHGPVGRRADAVHRRHREPRRPRRRPGEADRDDARRHRQADVRARAERPRQGDGPELAVGPGPRGRHAVHRHGRHAPGLEAGPEDGQRRAARGLRPRVGRGRAERGGDVLAALRLRDGRQGDLRRRLRVVDDPRGRGGRRRQDDERRRQQQPLRLRRRRRPGQQGALPAPAGRRAARRGHAVRRRLVQPHDPADRREDGRGHHVARQGRRLRPWHRRRDPLLRARRNLDRRGHDVRRRHEPPPGRRCGRRHEKGARAESRSARAKAV
ncbi:MAG: hypothetical protein AVDCRST_MAG64-4390, partial [uncultured Phycisphaerae bacterium]